MEVFVGIGSQRIKQLFKYARENSPAVIFIDEIDTIGRKRSKGGYIGGHSEQSATLNKLLVEIDGFTDNDNIMVIAATNMSEILDPALTRSGRFDKEIIFEAPNKDEREQLFDLYMKKIKLHDNITSNLNGCLEKLSSMTAGLTGADIANIVNQSAGTYLNRIKFNASSYKDCDNTTIDGDTQSKKSDNNSVGFMRNFINKFRGIQFNKTDESKTDESKTDETDNSNDTNKQSFDGVEIDDIIKSIDIVMVGMEKRERKMSDKEKEIVAYHEAGHALTAYILKDTEPPVKVSIIPRGKSALGFTQQEPTDQKIYTMSELYSRICVLLGGKVAEWIKFNHRSTGASDDIEKLTKIAHNIVTVYGMGEKVGSLNMVNDRYSDTYGSNISSAKKKEIDSEVQEIVDKAYKATLYVLSSKSEVLDKVAQYLLENEIITKDSMDNLLLELNIKNSNFIDEECELHNI
jgi:AFG3 family protein